MVNSTSFNQLGTTSFITGLSGSNFANSIKAEYQKDIASAAPVERQMVESQKKLARYKQLAELIGNLQGAAKKLSDSSFSARKAVMTSSNGSDATKQVKITTSAKAPMGRLSLKVLQIATAHKMASKIHASSTSALNLSGSFTIKAGSGTSATITLTNATTLDDVVKAINDKRSDTGVSASVVKVADNQFRLVLSGDKTNQKITIADQGGGTLSQNLGLLDASKNVVTELSAAKPAKLELNGLSVQRDSNQITDALPGVTFDLINADAGNLIKVDIENDRAAIKDQIKKFVESFNKFRQFVISQQRVVTGGGAAAGADLFGDSLLKNVSEAVFKQLGETVSVKGTSYSLRSFGLSMEPDNTLKLDSAKLDKAFSGNLEALQTFFAGQGAQKGLATRLKTTLENWSGKDDAILDKERKALDKQIADNRQDITEIKKRADARRKELITYYAKIEQRIAAAKLMVQQLQAFAKARETS